MTLQDGGQASLLGAACVCREVEGAWAARIEAEVLGPW